MRTTYGTSTLYLEDTLQPEDGNIKLLITNYQDLP
jgi:hypothetical protein